MLYFINLSILSYHRGFVEKGDKGHKFEIWDIRSAWMERRCKNKWDFEGIWEEIESKLIKYYKRINISLIGFLSYFDTKNSTFVILVNVLFIDDYISLDILSLLYLNISFSHSYNIYIYIYIYFSIMLPHVNIFSDHNTIIKPKLQVHNTNNPTHTIPHTNYLKITTSITKPNT